MVIRWSSAAGAQGHSERLLGFLRLMITERSRSLGRGARETLGIL